MGENRTRVKKKKETMVMQVVFLQEEKGNNSYAGGFSARSELTCQSRLSCKGAQEGRRSYGMAGLCFFSFPASG